MDLITAPRNISMTLLFAASHIPSNKSEKSEQEVQTSLAIHEDFPRSDLPDFPTEAYLLGSRFGRDGHNAQQKKGRP